MACWICETRAPPGAAHESDRFDVACVHGGVRGAPDLVYLLSVPTIISRPVPQTVGAAVLATEQERLLSTR
eukprot:6274383-Prymnesium_polylepis.1